MDGLTLLRDDQGQSYAQIEAATGRLYDLSGKFTGQKLERFGRRGQDDRDTYTEEGDQLLSQFAAAGDRQDRTRAMQMAGMRPLLKDGSGNGRQVNMDLAVADVHIPAALENYAGGYRLAEGVADLACPVIPVTKQQNKFFIWNSTAAFNRVIPNQAAPGSPPAEISPTLSNLPYITNEYSLASAVTLEVESNADAPLRPYQAAAMRLLNALRLEREYRVATLLTTSAQFASNNVIALAAGAQWNSGASSDPINNIQTLMERSALPVTRIVMGEPVYHAMVRNAAVRQYYFAKESQANTSSTVMPSGQEISALFKLPPIIVAEMKYFVGGVLTYVWPSAAGASSSVLFLHEPKQNPPTSQEDNATAYTFRWTTAPAPDGTITGGFLVRSYFDPKRGGRGSRVVVMAHNDAEVVTGNILGGLVTGVIQ